MKKSGKEDEASEYALAHLNNSETAERTKRILRRAVDRIAALDPEHLVVLRADYHGDEPCGTPNAHVAFVLRATGYKTGMPERVGSVRALEQMGFKKQKDTEYGIVQLHEKFKSIIEEEMIADALAHGYEPIRRKAPTGEKRKRSDVDVYREMAAEREELDAERQEQERKSEQQEQIAKRQAEKDREQELKDQKFGEARQIILSILHELGDNQEDYGTWGEVLGAIRIAAADYMRRAAAQAIEKADEAYLERTKTIDALRTELEREKQNANREKKLYAVARERMDTRFDQMMRMPDQYQAWAEKCKVTVKSADGKTEVKTIAQIWDERVSHMRQGIPGTPKMARIIELADKGLRKDDGVEL